MVPHDDAPRLATGTRLVHIGPHKTGTTALQGAFHIGRERLAEAGVVYVGDDRQPMRGALAVTGRPQMLGEPEPEIRHWDLVVREAIDAGDRYAVISSEFLADGDDDAARRVVTDLGGSPPVHVVVTLRPLTKIMPSQWQQYVQNGLRSTYPEWLEGMLINEPYDQPTPTFWKRHRHDLLVERWAAFTGPENLTVVIVDDSDRRMIVDTFEDFLGLPRGFLVPEEGVQNRSLTSGEVELVRRVNEEFKEREWPQDWYARFLRYGAVLRLRTRHRPRSEEARIRTPRWAAERAAELGEQMAKRIADTGVRVVGDLGALSVVPDPDPEVPPVLSPEAAAAAIVGVIGQYEREARSRSSRPSGNAGTAGPAGRSGSSGPPGPSGLAEAGGSLGGSPDGSLGGSSRVAGVGASSPIGRVEDRRVAEVPAGELVRVLLRRTRRRARRALHR